MIDISGIDQASLVQLINISLSFTLISFMPLLIYFVTCVIDYSTFLGPINHIHFINVITGLFLLLYLCMFIWYYMIMDE